MICKQEIKPILIFWTKKCLKYFELFFEFFDFNFYQKSLQTKHFRSNPIKKKFLTPKYYNNNNQKNKKQMDPQSKKIKKKASLLMKI